LFRFSWVKVWLVQWKERFRVTLFTMADARGLLARMVARVQVAEV
jgi:hypothetical protein